MRLVIAVAAVLMLFAGVARADNTAAAAPQMGGWLENAVSKFEAEAVSDVSMAPDVWSALGREWRSFDRDGSALGVFGDIGWVVVATALALIVERAVARLLSRRLKRRMRMREDGPHLVDMIGLLVCDLVGLAAFYAAFTVMRRHLLPGLGVTEVLAMFGASVLMRWRIVAVVTGAILRPDEPLARLVDISDAEARRLRRFLSAALLTIILLVAFGRYGLADEDSGAPHVIGLVNAVLVCGLYVVIVYRSRGAAEALIRGRRSSGMIARIRNAMAEAWVPTAMALVAGLFVFFIAGLSLGLLSYYHAATSTLGILFVVMVLDRLTERVWQDGEARAPGRERLRLRTLHRMAQATGLAIATIVLVCIWTDTIEMSAAASGATMRSISAAVVTLLVAFIAWEMARLAIDGHLQGAGGPALPGDEDDSAAPASRLQTILPLLRAAFGVLIAVLATLIVLSRLGVDTAPLIAGAGVFGLAVSFGSQSLVRDIISGLFYMWDDAFRVGEYIDTGRLKGTVETLGIRSVKLRHQNGPLHTVPYGQLGAVTNLSRDFSTVKFNLRLDPRTDIEQVRKATKQIGLAMQEENPEMATEIMAPLKLQGIAEVVDNALVLRFKFTARPVKPSWVQREYLKRMYKVFAEKGITFASGAVFIQTMPVIDTGPPDGEPPESSPPRSSPPPAPAGSPVATAAAAALGIGAALEVAELTAPASGGA